VNGEALWFLGTLLRPKLWGEDTGGELALWEGVLPRGAAPPVHTHPQAETFYVLEGEVTAWVDTHARRLQPGDVAHAAAGTPHAFRVESDTSARSRNRRSGRGFSRRPTGRASRPTGLRRSSVSTA